MSIRPSEATYDLIDDEGTQEAGLEIGEGTLKLAKGRSRERYDMAAALWVSFGHRQSYPA